MSSTKTIAYELPHELHNELWNKLRDLRKLGNIGKISKIGRGRAQNL